MSQISVAESCTGGMLAKYLTDLAGSSSFFKLGVITYSNEAKRDILGVKETTLDKYGAVSKECINEMLQGLYKLSKTRICIATSGLAGPGGDSAEKPVGLVYVGWLIDGELTIDAYKIKGNRDEIRIEACNIAIKKTIAKIRKTR